MSTKNVARRLATKRGPAHDRKPAPQSWPNRGAFIDAVMHEAARRIGVLDEWPKLWKEAFTDAEVASGAIWTIKDGDREYRQRAQAAARTLRRFTKTRERVLDRERASRKMTAGLPGYRTALYWPGFTLSRTVFCEASTRSSPMRYAPSKWRASESIPNRPSVRSS